MSTILFLVVLRGPYTFNVRLLPTPLDDYLP